jgi:hypothetical protein
MKKKQRKSYTTAFKVKVALEAIKGQRTIYNCERLLPEKSPQLNIRPSASCSEY